jgi:DNA-binding Lrp family transcriptional regulator
MLSEREKQVAKHIQSDISIEKRPFDSIGRKMGISGKEVLQTVRDLKSNNIVRKFGAVLRHKQAGMTENAMVVWAVPEGDCDVLGTKLASCREITHCYERTPPFEDKYNLFTMTHFKGGNITKQIRNIAARVGITEYKILQTEEEFKKSSMEYF